MATDRANKKPSALANALARPISLIKIPLTLISVVVGSLLISWVIEWIGLALFWYEEGSGHALRIRDAEIGHVNQALIQNGVVTQLADLAVRSNQAVYYWCFEMTGVIALFNLLGGFALLADVMKATLYVTQIFTLRLTTTVLSLPIFLLATIWGGCEGLVRRDLRRFGIDGERGFIYHESKLWLVSMVMLPILFYFAYPFELNPVFVFPPFALLMGMNVMVFTTTLPKHI